MKKAFTLVELLVVLVIIGVLIGLILPNTLKAIRQANNKECASNLRTIDTAIQMCYTDKRDWTQCDTIAELTTGKYLEQAPICPFTIAYAIEDSPAGVAGAKISIKTTHFETWPPGSGGRSGDHTK